MKKLFSSLIFLCLQGLAQADQNDPRLGDLFLELKSAPDAISAFPVEQRIWQVWLDHDNPQFRNLMDQGIRQMNRRNLNAALETFTQLTVMAPEYAEGWNKRATVHYLLGNYAASESDIEKTLMLEPFHFGALSGLGLVKIAQNQYLEARRAYLAALEVYPRMESAMQSLDALEELIRESSV